MPVNRRVAKNTIILICTNYMNAGANFLLFVLLARSLSVEAFGAFSASMAIALLAFQLCDLGVTHILTKRIAQEKEHTVALLSRIFTLRGLLAAAGLGGIVVVVWVVPSQARTLTLLLGIAALLEFMTEVLIAVFRGHERMSFEAWINGSRAVLTFGGGAMAIVAATTGQWIVPLDMVIALIFCAAGAVKLLAGLVLVGRQFTWRLLRVDVRYWGGFLREATPLGAAKVLTHVVNRLDIIFLVALLGERQAGFYSPAHLLYGGLMILWNAFLLSVFPRFSWMSARDVGAFWAEWKRAAVLMLLVTAGIAAIGVIWGPGVITMIYGPRYAESGTAFQILVIANVCFGLGSLCGAGLTALGFPGIIFRIHLAKVGINIAALALLIPRFGFVGAAVATLLTHGIGCIGLFMALSRRVRRTVGSTVMSPSVSLQGI